MPLVGPESTQAVDATVFIPTFNGEKYLDQLLNSVEKQNFAGTFEILIIDSGSSDSTLDIIAAHPTVRFVEIPGSEFGHGKTRNLAAKLARGTNIAYLSHDAIPADSNWLTNITAPLDPAGLNCVGVVGKHIARSNCSPLLKYEIEGVFRACGPDGETTVIDGSLNKAHELTPGELFYSDVNSATRRDFLLNVIAYRDVNYSEDMAFAQDLLKAGYRKAYAATAIVEHSNDVTFSEYGKRIFDETLGMRRVGQGRQSLSWIQAKLRAVRDILVSTSRIVRDRDYNFVQKLKWLLVNPAYAWTKWVNIHRALNISLEDEKKIAKYSLEAARA
ncbi:glycosyltransferase family 2 protein [Aurantimicrobium sp. MWH-Uga1]|uniref:glycosyltransferase n=1 Tax=Aurantimicrobium sp. MWH-Uga1 TaxID=2079575 RepID=UPI000DEE0200|nr:glycosyltransferase family 2 protein [Aurantimicrobium sp. MWH-Uga1]AXE54880.1 Chondroitin synthase [Aurantimicrobium sp. MWH-Uga1]